MKNNNVLRILAESEAEKYFVKDIMPNCEDEAIVRRYETLQGVSISEYEITHEDFKRCRAYIESKREGSV